MNFCLSEPGVIQFEKRGYLVKESVGDAEINVVRQNGADGVITVNYSTKDKTAVDGKDYEGQNGLLTFNHGETHQVTIRKNASTQMVGGGGGQIGEQIFISLEDKSCSSIPPTNTLVSVSKRKT